MPSRDKLLEVIAIQTEVARRGLDLGGVMGLVVQRTLGLVEADGAVVELAEEGDMVYRAAAGMAEHSLGLRLARDASLSGLCVQQGRALYCDNASTDPRTDRIACMSLGLQSMVVVPLRHHGETVGVLKAMSARLSHFKPQHLKLLELLSELVGASMYFATRYAPEALFHKATHDGLTDLPNRSMFLDQLRASLREGLPCAVVILDLDGLKPVNDRHGHRVGDAVLVEFGRRLAASVRHSDTPARIGGDEFAVLLRPVAPGSGLHPLVQRLAERVNGNFAFEGFSLPIEASLGAARYPEDAEDLAALLDLADQRMYSHKRGLQQALGRALA